MDYLISTEALPNNLVRFPSPQTAIPTPLRPLDLRNYQGPLSSEMWKTVTELKSSYSDKFDWSIYDQLYAKFGDKQPRGGVLWKTPLKLANVFSNCSKCHYSLELDTYGRGCVHNCNFCYARDQLRVFAYWNRPHPMPADLSVIRKIFHTVFETDRHSKWRPVLERRVPIRLGSMSDAFMWMDKKYGVTLELLKILKHYQYPYVVFTRSDLVSEPEYLKEIDPALASVQFSISSDNEEATRLIEPGAPSLKRRLESLKRLRAAGIWTAVRLNPLIPSYPDGYFSDPGYVMRKFQDRSIPKLNVLDIQNLEPFLQRIKESGVQTILPGFVRLSPRTVFSMGQLLDVNLREFFKEENYRSSGDSIYSDKEISHYYLRLRSTAKRLGFRFSTCFIGNGIKDYYQYQDLWTNKSDCCDIKGNVVSFNSSAQDIPWSERKSLTSHKDEAERAELLEKEYEQNPLRAWEQRYKEGFNLGQSPTCH